MKRLRIPILCFCLFTAAQLLKAGPVQLSDEEVSQIKQRLQAYEEDKLSFDEISGTSIATNMTLLTNMTVYFQTHSNDITTKMLLPVSRCFVLVGKFSNAAVSAQRYLNVYSNDCRGWSILIAATYIAQSYSEALEAGTNALRFGCEENLPAIGASAVKVDRIDVAEKVLIPRMLAKKDSESNKKYRMDLIAFLAYYGLNTTNEALYLKALQGVKRSDLRDRSDLRRTIKDGCELFKTKEVERICKELN